MAASMGTIAAKAAADRLMFRTLEPRTDAEPEELGLVMNLFMNGNAKIDVDETEGRIPTEAKAGGGADRAVIGNLNLLAARRIIIEGLLTARSGVTIESRHALQAANIKKCPAGDANVGRNRKREANFAGLVPFEAPAQAIAGGQIMRTDAAGGKSAQIITTQEESIDDLFRLAQGQQVADSGA